ncbi:hypothetical protein G1J88_02430 [Tenacibaculum dicentrarchi]|nr:hypothetical protein [Tenacibaculum dicentrarchi]MCD8419323.1 hypothetical protein [Tenacibaculum dicentrarchi]MCD8436342.1 hypothetical protein [Tenacibaculum dicentrarchi]MCG8827236.1 hypothetical protein [Tenacibaculum dicentrarchi]WBX68743.1 hypothetical protein PG910_11855 [Tenacibaculum dicentrarchi]
MILQILLSIVNILLNPFSFLLFILFSFRYESYFFTKEETNVSKLKLAPYIFFTGIYLSIILSITYLFSLFIDFNIWKFFAPKHLFISVITWLITTSTLRTYLKGMEGNIMGFIFFPMLGISMFTLFVFSFFDILSSYQFLTIHFPVLEINFWIRLLLHFFMPFYVLIYLNSNQEIQDENKELPNKFPAAILSILILQFFFFGLNWLFIYLFGSSINLSQFLGEGQTIVYYLPMISGFLYVVLFFTSKMKSSKTASETASENKKQNILETLSYYSMLLIFGSIILEMINYLILIRPFFN